MESSKKNVIKGSSVKYSSASKEMKRLVLKTRTPYVDQNRVKTMRSKKTA